MALLVLARSSAAQETITVTTLQDTADSPFDADDPCGVGTLAELPGADGEVSLREAIIAANNTAGEITIGFDPSLIGKNPLTVGFDTQDADLALNPLPWLCGGVTNMIGDVDGDGESDITLEGSALEEGEGLIVTSSGNSIMGMTLINFPGSGVVLLPLSDTTLTSNTLLSNVISGSGSSGIRLQAGFSGTGDPVGHIAQTTIQENSLQFNGSFGVSVAAFAPPEGSDASISDTTIAGNNIEGNTFSGIVVQTTGVSSSSGPLTIANTTISNNAIVVNEQTGIFVVAGNAQDAVITQLAITGNTIAANRSQGLAIMGGEGAATGNTVDGVIEGNTVVDNNKTTELFKPFFFGGIGLLGGATFEAGEEASQNTLTMEVSSNFVQGNSGIGIGVSAGQNGAVDNTVDVLLMGNTIADHPGFNLTFAGGVNTGLVAVTASRNTLIARATDNQVSGSGIFGVAVFGGFVGLAQDNTVLSVLSDNTVEDSGEIGIAFFGGLVKVLGEVAGNMAEGTIVGNTADGIECEDGVEGNSARCVQIGNTITP